MTSLSWHEADKAFILQTADKALADQVRADGWGRTKLGGSLPAGQHARFTREPYAALGLWKHGDEMAKQRLSYLRREYKASLARESDYRVEVPSTLPDWIEPFPFQRAGVKYAMERSHTLIGDDMGLGKTAQAIMVANGSGAERVLVICPANARSQWVESIKTWSVIPRVYRSIYPIYKSSDGISPFAKYIVTSFDLMRREPVHAGLFELKWDLVIIDEAHYLKEVTSQRSQRAFGSLDGKVRGLIERAGKVLCLTGTPLPNRPRECYNMARHLCWDSIDWLSEDAFTRRFNPSVTMMTGHVMEYESRLPELRARLRCNFMIRRLLRDVQPQMPPEFHEIIHIEPDGAIRKVLKAESLLEINVDEWEELDFQTRGHIALIRHEMGVAKVPRVVEHIRMLMDGGLDKLFVVAYHRDVITKLREKFASYQPAVIWGGQTPLQRDKEKLRFIQDPECQILFGQINAVGEAVDGLQAVCRLGVFAEPSWVHKDNIQVCRRLIRMGQKLSVQWQYLMAPQSLDEKILGKSIKKGIVTSETLDG